MKEVKEEGADGDGVTWMRSPQKKSRLPESSTGRASQLLARNAIGLQTAEKGGYFTQEHKCMSYLNSYK